MKDSQSLELSLNHGFLKCVFAKENCSSKHFIRHMNFCYVSSVNNNDGDGLVENLAYVMIGNRMRFGTIKET